MVFANPVEVLLRAQSRWSSHFICTQLVSRAPLVGPERERCGDARAVAPTASTIGLASHASRIASSVGKARHASVPGADITSKERPSSISFFVVPVSALGGPAAQLRDSDDLDPERWDAFGFMMSAESPPKSPGDFDPG
jgi:hypothetical protein